MSGRMLVTKAVACDGNTGLLCQDSTGQFWYTARRGHWVTSGGFGKEARDVSLLLPIYSYSDYETFNKIHGRNIAPTNTQPKGDSVQTLDNMTVEQLRDLATRANNAAEAQEKKGRIYLQFPDVLSAWMERSTGRIYCVDTRGGPVRESYWTNDAKNTAEIFRRALSGKDSPQAVGLNVIFTAILAEHNK